MAQGAACRTKARLFGGPAGDHVLGSDIEILPSSTLFRAGESLQLVVQGADLFEHPTLTHAYSRDVNTGVHAIHTGGEYDSHLLVPEIPR